MARRRWLVAIGSVFLLAVVLQTRIALEAQSAAPTAAQTEFFEKSIQPMLAQNCVGCHGNAVASGGLRLDSRDGLLKGGQSGPAVVAGDPAKSLLIEAVRHTGTLKMPQGGQRLSALLGVTFHPQSGPLHNQHFHLQGDVPVAQSLDGPQLQRSWVVRFGWQIEF